MDYLISEENLSEMAEYAKRLQGLDPTIECLTCTDIINTFKACADGIKVVFPNNSTGDTITYIGENGELKRTSVERGATLFVAPNSFMISSMGNFDNTTFILPSECIRVSTSIAYLPYMDECIIEYADNAPV